MQLSDEMRDTLADALRGHATVDLRRTGFPVETNSWTLDRHTLQFLVSLVRVLKPKHILEFGGGLSTGVLAWACAQIAFPTELVSIDHDPHFLRSTLRELRRQEAKCDFSLHHAPLVLRPCLDQLLPIYDLEPGSVPSAFHADLILIDGPPLALGGRAGMLFQAMEFAKSGTLILLDDSARREERQALALWRETFGEAIAIVDLESFPKGLSAIQVQEPVPLKRLAEYTSQLAARELRPLVAQVEKCVLIDNGLCCAEQLVPNRPVCRFGEKEGIFAGPPADSSAAVVELQQLDLSPAALLIFAWPAFWWFDCYADFLKVIRTHFTSVLETPRVRVFRREKGST
ncbi:MAG TPA: hypothetical protein VL361_03595 [Candidatus Limnocylindrales bacterium]|nr:hypothetical protein [Candidatus Limnocylindrales bacterium]